MGIFFVRAGAGLDPPALHGVIRVPQGVFQADNQRWIADQALQDRQSAAGRKRTHLHAKHECIAGGGKTLGKLPQLLQPHDVAGLPGLDGRGQAAGLRRLAHATVELLQFRGQFLVDPPYLGEVPPDISAGQHGQHEDGRGGKGGRFGSTQPPRRAMRMEEVHRRRPVLGLVDEHPQQRRKAAGMLGDKIGRQARTSRADPRRGQAAKVLAARGRTTPDIRRGRRRHTRLRRSMPRRSPCRPPSACGGSPIPATRRAVHRR